MSYIKRLDDISSKDVTEVGGKGASLGEMTQAGIPVPHGFVITTAAYQAFAKATIPETVQKELLKAFGTLHTERVAVRSSAVAEDSSTSSWAGQLESYLNVTKEGLLEAVKKCWDSLQTERVMSYAKEHKTPKSQLLVAVVVQKMVDSDISGVMFTVNPVTADKNELMIEASYGLGELLVQGEITPDNYIVDKKTLQITSRSQGSQAIMLTYQNGKHQKISVPHDLQGKPVLNDYQITELTTLGKTIEDHYQSPQDIEWAIEEGKISIVQSRPITTLS